MNCSHALLPSNTTIVGRPTLTTSNCSADMNNASDVSGFRVWLEDVSVTLWCVVPPVLLVAGTLGNVMIMVVMRGMRSSSSTACLSVYFTALAVSDQCLLIASTVWFGVDGALSWPPSFYRYHLLCSVPYFVFYTCSPTSAWFLVAMTYQRVTSVVAPHRVVVLCTVRRGKMIIGTIIVLACALGFHVMITFAYRPEYTECLYHEEYVDIVYVFTWLDLFWASVIPFVLLIIGNSVLIGHVIKSTSVSQQMRGNVSQKATSANSKVYSMTMTLILTSAAFLILTCPVCVVHTYKRSLGQHIADGEFRAKLNLVETVTLLLWSGASASNYYLYLLSGSKFRQETKRYLCRHGKHGMS